MATGWVRALQCKSNVLHDVYHPPPPPPPKHKKHKPPPPYPSSSTTTTSLLPLGCGNSSHTLKDVVLFPEKKHHNQYHHRRRRSQSKPTKTTPPPPLFSNPSPFPTLTELPPGHSSRRVVEIIFSSSWSLSPPPAAEPFPGVIEMLFKVHNPSTTVAKFEAHREKVRDRAGNDDPRCAVDGNEMMRFHSAQATAGKKPVYDCGVICSCQYSAGKGIRTFAGCGGAHESGGGVGGGARGGSRRAMLVCRVIAGRVRIGSEPGPGEYESVLVGKGGELVVFDPAAVLPCFLIIYRV